MRKIIHLSDVHFGTTDPRVVRQVTEKVTELDPHLVVLSGDLTQRAKSEEFAQAKDFLDSLPGPQIVVPGNHDVPLYNLFDRFFRKLHKFEKYITADLTPTFFDDELAVVGVNTARSMVIKGGRINDEQIEFIKSQLCGLDEKILKVVVTHHPFDLPEDSHHSEVVGNAAEAMPAIAACGGDVLLAGHLHVSHIETTAKRYPLEGGGNALVIQAGTATSTRVRGEAHSFNLIEFEHPRLDITRYESHAVGEPFTPTAKKGYTRGTSGWLKVEEIAG
jgi:3',5'-cyclic AMP phosphodiesterase CpdA